jgi:hypothetical protein
VAGTEPGVRRPDDLVELDQVDVVRPAWEDHVLRRIERLFFDARLAP